MKVVKGFEHSSTYRCDNFSTYYHVRQIKRLVDIIRAHYIKVRRNIFACCSTPPRPLEESFGREPSYHLADEAY
ncbi:MAG: hypothetical protein WA364_27835 [Candidatus Nitrosopolaris sp.]